jgi:hypothetical protein
MVSGTIGKLLVAGCVLAGAACTSSSADEPPAASASPSSEAIAWPDDYGVGEEGAWTTGPLTTDEIIARAKQQKADLGCVRDFIDAIGYEETITWDLYLKDGTWILYGGVDDETPEGFDRGTYTMWHVEGQLALFSSMSEDARDDFWVYPRFEGDSLTMNVVEVNRSGARDDPTCFVRAAGYVELSNTFVPTG